jgi:hypothetical protein
VLLGLEEYIVYIQTLLEEISLEFLLRKYMYKDNEKSHSTIYVPYIYSTSLRSFRVYGLPPFVGDLTERATWNKYGSKRFLKEGI